VESAHGWTAMLADVSGHGVGAGVLMGMVKAVARTELRAGATLDRLQTTLSRVLYDLKAPTMFATFAALQHTAAELRFTVAGHLPILRCHGATQQVEELSLAQLPLAMFEDTRFTSQAVTAEPGDLFVLLTDGLTEVFDRHDEDFGLERVKRLIAAHAAAPLAQIEERLLAAVRAHGTQMDDQTLLLVRRL
jgi:phosphoserine phosphatase RsbU/P